MKPLLTASVQTCFTPLGCQHRLLPGVIALALWSLAPCAGAQLPATVSLSVLNGDDGFRLEVGRSLAEFGYAVSAAGDLNGDGIADMVIGEPASGQSVGRAYVVFGRGEGFAAQPMVVPTAVDEGVVFSASDVSDGVGFSVRGAGDINGDLRDDLLIGAPSASGSGRVYVVFGRDTGFPVSIDLSQLNGSDGFRIEGMPNQLGLGFSLAAADVNGDDINDMVLGAYHDSPTTSPSGAAYVVFGSDQSFAPVLFITSLDGSNGFALTTTDERPLGRAVSAGDLNGDGIADIVIGAPQQGDLQIQPGRVHVVYGKNTGFSAAVSVDALDGSQGFHIDGTSFRESAGFSLAMLEDLNGDGIADLAIGAPQYGYQQQIEGRGYIVFGRSDAFPAVLRLDALDGTNGFAMAGSGVVQQAGWAMADAGDINGDGRGDLLVGTLQGSDATMLNGLAYVVYGNKTGFSALLELGSLDGANGFRIQGERSDDWAGASVAGVGDVNHDGRDDVLIGAHRFGDNGLRMGRAYAVLGSDVLFDEGFEAP